VICGLGAQGYELALDAIASLIEGEADEADR
jgi:3-dehydroquinate dehydratase